jgi:osmotically inducible protein OsmC
MKQADKLLCAGRPQTNAGREHDVPCSSDSRLDIKLSILGSGGANPEQLFAAGWSACFERTMGLTVSKMKVAVPADASLDAEVDQCLVDGAYFLQARLNVSLPGLNREASQALADAVRPTCLCSKAARGNIDVVINIVSPGPSSGSQCMRLPDWRHGRQQISSFKG